MGLKVISRKSWGARPSRGSDPNPIGPGSTLFVHYSAASGVTLDKLSEQKEAVRGIQRLHQDTNGWNDIGYSYLVAQGHDGDPHLFKGRGFDAVPAAQVGHNTGNGAVCVLMGPGDPLRDSTVDLLREVFRHFPGKALKGHRDVNPTACPGDKLYAALGRIRTPDKVRPSAMLD